MSSNLILNGDFETGDFQHWTVTESDGKARVVHYNGSQKAEIRLGLRQTVMLDTGRFPAGPVEFKLLFQASVPQMQTQKAPRNQQAGPSIFARYLDGAPLHRFLT
jgi:uncharacterized SAM-dependent methyltransferase